MVTIYEVLEVSEDASKEEIEKAYAKLVYEYRIDPNLSEEDNKENELLLNKLKIAYGILANDEKRKKYDQDLAQKRAEELANPEKVVEHGAEKKGTLNGEDVTIDKDGTVRTIDGQKVSVQMGEEIDMSGGVNVSAPSGTSVSSGSSTGISGRVS